MEENCEDTQLLQFITDRSILFVGRQPFFSFSLNILNYINEQILIIVRYSKHILIDNSSAIIFYFISPHFMVLLNSVSLSTTSFFHLVFQPVLCCLTSVVYICLVYKNVFFLSSVVLSTFPGIIFISFYYKYILLILQYDNFLYKYKIFGFSDTDRCTNC